MKDRVKLYLGAMVYPAQTRRWTQFLDQNAVLRELAKLYPRLIHKIYRPYVSNQLNCSSRVDLLIGHYSILFESGFGGLIRQAAQWPITMCEFTGKSGTILELQLSAVNISHREGELCLRLVSNGQCVYSVVFILLVSNDEYFIKIGCLQGLRSVDGRFWIKRATRDLHGCRPKNLMVSVVQNIGDYFGCTRTLLVSNKNRIAINPWRRRQIYADYDTTWQEMRATKSADGDFELPCGAFQNVRLETVAAKKRSEVKKRGALIKSIFDAIRERLDESKLAAGIFNSTEPLEAMKYAENSGSFNKVLFRDIHSRT